MNHARALFLGLALLATAGSMTSAVATTLVCHLETATELGPTTVDLDETQGSIVVHFSAWQHPIPTWGIIQAMTIGPLPARFDDNTIAFSNSNLPESYVQARGAFTINRTTGEFVNTSTNWRWTCKVGKRQF